MFWSAGLFLLAFAFRLLSLNFIQPFEMGSDENFYVRTALHFASGGSSSNQFFMPGWPWILSWFARVDDAVFFLRHCAVLLGSISVVIVYHLGRRVLTEETGRLAALLLCIYPDHLLFSNLLQAEASIELCTLVATTFAFWHRPMRDRSLRDAVAAVVFGSALLVKHFIAISFVGFLASRDYAKARLPRLALVCAAFLLPVIVHGAYLGLTGRDPLTIVNSPLKSAGEWGNAFIAEANFTPGIDRGERLKHHLDWIVTRPVKDTAESIRKNLFNLWAPGTFGIRRILTGFYSISPGRWLSWVHAAFYGFVIVLGIYGMAFAASSPFRTYAIVSIAVLSSMSVVVYLVTRYRHSFEFLFFMFAADVLAHRSYYRTAFLQASPFRLGGWLAATTLFLFIFFSRLPHMASYQ